MSIEDDLSPETYAETLAEAWKEFDVIVGNSRSLLLDLDSDHAYAQFCRVLPTVIKFWQVDKVYEWRSKNNNRHVHVILGESVPFSIRVCLQSALGSDGRRDVLAMVRNRNGVLEPFALFRPKNALVTELELQEWTE